MSNAFINYLNSFSETDWLEAVEHISRETHEVDRKALKIWFRFYPLSLARFLAGTENMDETLRSLALQGDFDLKDQIDTSHHFLYGHRYWKTVKCKIEKEAEEFKAADAPSLEELIKLVAIRVGKKLNVERPLLNAIAAVGLATLNQGGMDAFKASPGDVSPPTGIMTKLPETIVAERAKDDSQGLFGFLKTVDKKFSVSFAASQYAGKFPVLEDQELTLASANVRSEKWKELDERCWEGPVPVECTAASCGTCWIGVLGGEGKLTDVGPRERRQMKVFGYNQPEDEKPYLRLACQARATGNITIVIPPWNGVFGRKVYGNIEEVELEPVTTSAKALRETIASATSSE